jgi:uncharacterized membrane protein
MADRVTKSITVRAPIQAVYDVWDDFANFPSFMKNIESVTMREPGFSHWVMSGPMDRKFEWDAETTLRERGRRIAWNSKDGSAVTTSGQVVFAALGAEETQVTVTLQYEPPAGLAGDIVTALFARPEQRLDEDLRNLKAFVEGMPNRIKH